MGKKWMRFLAVDTSKLAIEAGAPKVKECEVYDEVRMASLEEVNFESDQLDRPHPVLVMTITDVDSRKRVNPGTCHVSCYSEQFALLTSKSTLREAHGSRKKKRRLH